MDCKISFMAMEVNLQAPISANVGGHQNLWCSNDHQEPSRQCNLQMPSSVSSSNSIFYFISASTWELTTSPWYHWQSFSNSSLCSQSYSPPDLQTMPGALLLNQDKFLPIQIHHDLLIQIINARTLIKFPMTIKLVTTFLFYQILFAWQIGASHNWTFFN